MEAVLKSLPVYMLIGIVIVIGISQVNRVIGASLGVLFWVAVGFVGIKAYDLGGAIGFPGLELPRPVFLLLCVVFVIVHVYTAYASVQAKKRKALRKKLMEDCDEDL